MNNGKKFITFCNPPYGGTTGSDNAIDIRFIEKIMELSYKAIISPPTVIHLQKILRA